MAHGADAQDKARHLPLLAPVAPVAPLRAAPMRTARWTALALTVAAVALFVAAYFLPWWRFWLYAPQYPGGLKLTISLTGMQGDVSEINLLNHYIGMGHLDDAAPMERRYAAYALALLSLVVVAVILGAGRKLNRYVAFPAISFPVLFVADSFFWLYTFGHRLNPHAPLKVPPFTPQLFGNGQIGQFETYAEPALGFWCAVIGVCLVVVATVLRSRVCDRCGQRSKCSTTCPRALVLTSKDERTEPSGAAP